MSEQSDKPAFARKNDGLSPLRLWVEPWAEEFQIAPKSTVEIFMRGSPVGPLDVEESTEQITIYAPAGATLSIKVDGSQIRSLDIPVPDAGPLGTKGFVNLVFGDSPEARPGGATYHAPTVSGWRSRLKKLFQR